SGSPMVSVSRSGRRNISLSKTRANPSTDEPSNHSPLRMACGRRCAGMVMLLTVPSTSTKRKSRKRMPRSDSRSSARSVVSDVVRPAAASVFAVRGLHGYGRARAIVLAPGWAGTRVVTGSPGLVFLCWLVHDVAPLLMVDKGGCQGEWQPPHGRTNGLSVAY